MDTDEERQREIASVVWKVLAVVAGIGLTIGIGTWGLVNALGLDDAEVNTTGPGPVQPVTPLPTTALPVPGEYTPSATPTGLVTPTDPATSGDLYLAATPAFVGPMERINLTGQWPGHDAVGLAVQRLEGGKWVDFGVQTQVRVGTFETYVMTGRAGENTFRVFDPSSDTASNQVTVTVE